MDNTVMVALISLVDENLDVVEGRYKDVIVHGGVENE